LKYLISIIVVCKNENSINIDNTFTSILNQTYQYFELIVIDGNSNQITKSNLNKYSSRINIFISEDDSGIFNAMNKGIMNSNGEWLIFLNIGDLFYSKNVLDYLVKNINQHKVVDIFYGQWMHGKLGLLKPPQIMSKYLMLNHGICHQAMILNISCFKKIGLYNEKIGMSGDPDWNMRAIINGLKLKYIDLIFCYYEGRGLSSNTQVGNSVQKYLKTSYLNRLELPFYNFYSFFLKLSNYYSKKIKTN
jgi:glycosyltransferase involved in cell wall biosynthesis